jgi:hypothetical protein
MMMHRISTTCSIVAVLAISSLVAPAASGAPSAPSCPQTSTPTTWVGTTLDVNTTKNGTLYNGPGANLELNHSSVFVPTTMSNPGKMVYAAVGDFNNDGWPDFVGADETTNGYLNIFQNYTWQSENCTTPACTQYSPANGAPNWNSAIPVAPSFTMVRSLHTPANGYPLVNGNPTGFNGRYELAAADFNGDGWDDVLELQAPASGYQITTVTTRGSTPPTTRSPRPTRSRATSGF